MIENLSGATGQLLKLAADAALLRQEVISNNIANADTPGFHAKRVTFEQHLTQFITEEGGIKKNEFENQKDYLTSMLKSGDSIVSSGEPVELDQEMIQLTENVLRYQAILDALSKRGSLISMAIKEGR